MCQRHVKILVAIFIIALAAKLLFSTQEYLIHNNDAGYYVKNINGVLRDGYPSASEPPLPFYYAALFASVLGVMLGFKAAIAIASAGIAFPVYKIAERIGNDERAALLAAFLAAFSPTNMFMMGDLLKNMVGLFFGFWMAYFILKATDRFTVRDGALAAACALLMLGSHLSSSAYMMLAVAPFLALFPAYSYWESRKLGREMLFSIAMAGMLLICGVAVILLKGMDVSQGKVGVVGLYAEEGAATALFDEYLFFLIPLFLGLGALARERLLLIVPWLVMAFLLTQPLFASEAWTFRFGWDTYPLVAMLSGLSILHFRKQEALMHGLVIVLGIYTLAGFVAAGEATHPVILDDEWEGMLRLHDERPDVLLVEVGGPVTYWADAAGLMASDRPDARPYVLLCDETRPGGNGWLEGACKSNPMVGPEDIMRLEAEGKVVASFGRFIIVEKEDYGVPFGAFPEDAMVPRD